MCDTEKGDTRPTAWKPRRPAPRARPHASTRVEANCSSLHGSLRFARSELRALLMYGHS